MKRRVEMALGGLAVAAALVGAGRLDGREATAADTPRGGTLRIMSSDDLRQVDPALAWGTDEWLIEYATCAKLFNHPDAAGAAGARAVPEVVRSYNVSRNGRTYTFELKRTFRFHTGEPVTAQSFADALNRDVDPRMRSPATSYMREIEGATAAIDGKARKISGVRVLDRYRLQIRLTKPLVDFTDRLTMPFFCPLLPNTPIDPNGIDNPPGSGPYYVAERVPNQRIVLQRNPFYRGDRPANVNAIVYSGDQRIEACLEAVEDDRADFCGEPGAPRDAFRELAEKYGVNTGGRLFVRPSLVTWFVAFNHERPVFRGPGQIPLKKAINFAIDRPALTRAFGYLAGKRTDQMLPPAWAHRADIYPLGGARPEVARRWYAKARVQPDKLVLYAWNLPLTVTLAQVLVYNLEQIGIDLEVKYFEPQTVVDRALTTGEPYDLVMTGWAADYPAPAGFFLSLLPGGAFNVAHLDDPRIRRSIEAASRLTGEARERAWADLDVELMRDDSPWAPFMHINSRTFVSKSLGCFVAHPIYRVDIVAVCKKR